MVGGLPVVQLRDTVHQGSLRGCTESGLRVLARLYVYLRLCVCARTRLRGRGLRDQRFTATLFVSWRDLRTRGGMYEQSRASCYVHISNIHMMQIVQIVAPREKV